MPSSNPRHDQLPSDESLFDRTGVARTSPHGGLEYQHLPHSLVDMLRATSQRCPDVDAVKMVGETALTYADLWTRSAAVAGGLRDMGVEPGDRVAITYGNSVEWCLSFWGALLAGAVVVPVNTRFAEAEVDYVLADSGASVTLGPTTGLPSGDPVAVSDRGGDDVAAIFYTSGTTGRPKGACTTHNNFLANSENCRRTRRLPAEQRLRSLVSVPLFHVTGCNSQLVAMAQMGGTVIIMGTFDAQAFLRAIQDEQVDMTASVPAIYWLALQQPNAEEFDLRSVRWLTYGGAPIAPELIERLRVSFPNAKLGNGYGLTETSSISTFLPDELTDAFPDSVGRPAPCVEVRLDKADADADVGELLIRGQNIVAGYWNDPERTAQTFVDGWLRTGDLASIDETGLVRIKDRLKDMINRGGENVYSIEVENALVLHDDVLEVAVVGVPDEMMGEKVGAVLVLRPAARSTAEEIVASVADHIADFKVPEFVSTRSAPLPRNPGGKVLKGHVRDEASWQHVGRLRPGGARSGSPSESAQQDHE